MSSQSKKNTFYGAAALLTVTTIVVKIIGAIYKIPLTALLPDEAYGDFGAAYNIYSFFLTISTAGLPVALSKTVSECNALGRENQKERVFRMAFCAFLFMGVFSFICMSVFSQFVATHVLQNEKAVYAVLALAPAVLCTCICSAFRGYAQGHMNMVPTGSSFMTVPNFFWTASAPTETPQSDTSMDTSGMVSAKQSIGVRHIVRGLCTTS